MEYYISVLRDKYAVFEGRATRSEFWYFVLFNLLVSIALGIVDGVLFSGMGVLGLIYGLAVFIPGLAVSVRRLHDTGRSGWWILLSLIPLIGLIVLLVFYVMDSQPGVNAYGPNPKEMGNGGNTGATSTVPTEANSTMPPTTPAA